MGKDRYNVVWIDCENVSWRACEDVASILQEQYRVDSIKNKKIFLFALEEDNSKNITEWKRVAEYLPHVKWILLAGYPKKNKVDKVIIKNINDFLRSAKNKDVTDFILVSSDGGYASTVDSIKKAGKKVTVISAYSCSEKLVNYADEQRIYTVWKEKNEEL